MSISEIKQGLNQIGKISKPEPKKAPSPSPGSKGLFEKKREYSRPEFRKILRKASPFIPGAGGKMFSRQERIKMEKEIFPEERYKSHISEIEVKRRFRELRMEKYKSKIGKEKLDIDRKLRFLKDITGVKPWG